MPKQHTLKKTEREQYLYKCTEEEKKLLRPLTFHLKELQCIIILDNLTFSNKIQNSLSESIGFFRENPPRQSFNLPFNNKTRKSAPLRQNDVE